MATITAFVRGTKENTTIRFRIRDGKAVQLFYKGSITINPEIFDAKKEQVKARVLINNNQRTNINNYILQTKEKINTIYTQYKPTTSQQLTSLMNGEPSITYTSNISELIEEKIKYVILAPGTIVKYRKLKNTINNYLTQTRKQWEIDTLTVSDIKDFESFMLNAGYSKNYVRDLIKDMKSVCLFAIKYDYTRNNPFKKYEPIQAVYGTPTYLTLEERDLIFKTDLTAHPKLAVQRDIFVFQCHVGCRVSNLIELTDKNVIKGFLEYIPAKTIRQKGATVRVPLTNTAIEIINRYKDGKKLLPFISTQKYNDDIKEILKLCGITRMVTTLDPRSRKEKNVPLYTVASSHLARRTFCANLYKKVKDPNLIGSMSGHAPGSRAFERYRTIDDEIKKETINLIE